MNTNDVMDRTRYAESRGRILCGLALLMVVGSVMLTSHQTVEAQTNGLEQRVSALEQQVTALQAALSAEASARQLVDVDLTGRTVALEEKTHFMSVSGAETIFTGTNVHVVNGLGSTDTSNTLGNLIVGYNASRGFDVRSGSHYVIVGDQHNYSAYGGIVVGFGHTATGPYAAVSGGNNNTANGQFDSVSGGAFNTAASNLSPNSGYTSASVSGGAGNRATNGWSTVCGGNSNVASGQVATVSGGYFSTASGFSSSVSGGFFVTQAVGTGWSGGAYHTP